MELVNECLVGIAEVNVADYSVDLDLAVMLILLLNVPLNFGLRGSVGFEDVLKNFFLSLFLWFLDVKQSLQQVCIKRIGLWVLSNSVSVHLKVLNIHFFVLLQLLLGQVSLRSFYRGINLTN